MHNVNEPVLKLHRMQDRMLVLAELLYNAGMYESDDCGRFGSFDVYAYIPFREEYPQWQIDALTEYLEMEYYIQSVTTIDLESAILESLPSTHL